MFNGIVQAVLPVAEVDKQPGLIHMRVSFPPKLKQNVQLGASIAFNGVCLTVAYMDEACLGFDIIQQTLDVTNLKALYPGCLVNVERAAKWGDEVGGHPLSGHVCAVVELVERVESPNNVTFKLKAPEHFGQYLFSKGYVGVNGASLTLAEVEKNSFWVHLIPETLRQTTFDQSQVGDCFNLEVDQQTRSIVDTLEHMLTARGLLKDGSR